MLERLTDAEVFEQFLQTKFLTEKRFSLEGAESLIPMMDRVIDGAAELGAEDIVIGMAHRGRLNVLANVLGKPPAEIFRGFLKFDEDGRQMLGRGDVKYHLGYCGGGLLDQHPQERAPFAGVQPEPPGGDLPGT